MKHSWISRATDKMFKICNSCRHLSFFSDRELCCTYYLCQKYGGYIGNQKHRCKRLRKGIVRRIRQYAKEEKEQYYDE